MKLILVDNDENFIAGLDNVEEKILTHVADGGQVWSTMHPTLREDVTHMIARHMDVPYDRDKREAAEKKTNVLKFKRRRV